MNNKKLVREVQSIVFEILCDIDDYCKRENFTYYLSGGTCLGAIRHHGFIPWDDDADLMMPRQEYEKFLVGFAAEYKDKYGVGSLYTDELWQRPFARIWSKRTKLIQTKVYERAMGVFIDVFPIDGLPKSKFIQNIFYFRLKVCNVLRNSSIRKDFHSYENYRSIKKLLGLFTKRINPRKLAIKMDQMAKHYSFDNSEKVAVSLALHYWDKETIEKKEMEEAVYMTFEGKEFPVPIGYRRYLENLYGNYMEIPKDAAEKGYSHLESWDIQISKRKADSR